MKLSDQKVIDFISKSPLRSFAAMLDVLRYLDGQWIYKELEYELFDKALDDNEQRKVTIRVPHRGGIEANALFAFTQHASKFHMIRRRARSFREPNVDPDELIVFYSVTPAGKIMINILTAIVSALNS